jgi:hypothetical protein
VRALREAAGERPYDIAVGGRSREEDWEAERDRLHAVAAAGATWSGEYVPPDSREAMRAAVDRGPLRID